MNRRYFLLAILVAAFALLPLSRFGLAAAKSGAQMNSSSPEDAADNVIQFSLVPEADQIAACMPNAVIKVKVLTTEDETGTDTFILNAKGLRPNTTFAVFLTELPVGPFGAVQYIADLHSNANGKASVVVNAIIKDAFVSQVIDGVRVRKDLNHIVMWFADPADANDCFAPAAAGVTGFDGDGNAGPAAFSSKGALPGAPLP